MRHSTQPPLQKFFDSVQLHSTSFACARYRREPNTNFCDWSIEFRNVSEVVANFKLQGTTALDGSEDNQVLIEIKAEESASESKQAVGFFHAMGKFNDTFSDITNTTLSIVPGGAAVLNFRTAATFVQILPLTANGARVRMAVSTSSPVTIWSHEEVHRTAGVSDTWPEVPSATTSDGPDNT